MKNVKLNKRKISSLPVLLVILLVSIFTLGLTLAWYYNSKTTNDGTIKMSTFNLNIEDGAHNMNDQAVITTNITPNLVPNQSVELDPLTLLITSNSPVSIRIKILPVDESGIILEDSLLLTSDNWVLVGDYYYYVSGSGESWTGYYPASDTTTSIDVTDITFRINSEIEEDKASLTASFSVQVEMCQAGWAHTGAVTTNLPIGTSGYDAASNASILEAWIDEGGEVYTASPHTVIANAGSLGGEDLVGAINSAETDFVFVPLDYQTFDEEVSSTSGVDTSKTVFLYQKQDVVSSANFNKIDGKQVSLSSKVNLAPNKEVSIIGLYQSEEVESYALAVPEYIEDITVTNIADYAFAGNMALTGVTFSRYVKTIGENAFVGCENMETAVFNNISRSQCTTIGNGAFGESGLTTITIPSSVTTIGELAFAYTYNLSSINVYGGTKFRADSGVLYNYARTTLYNYPSAKTGSSFTIPSTVTKICPFAFNEDTHTGVLTSISMSSAIVDIGESSLPNWLATTSSTGIKYFQGGTAVYVVGVNDPATLTNSDISTFWTQMSSSYKYVRALASWAFFGFSPSLETYIGASNVTSITLPSTLYGIGYGSFSQSGISSITIPSSVKYIAPGAFSGTELASISVSGTYYKTVNGALLNYAGTSLICYPKASAATSYSIPSTVTRVENYAFNGATNLTAITFAGTSCNYIGEGAFANTSISSFTIPTAVTKIATSAFGDNVYLTSITIHQYITIIGVSAFQNCPALTSVTFSGTSTCHTICEMAFATTGLTSITLPTSCTNVHPDAFYDTSVVL